MAIHEGTTHPKLGKSGFLSHLCEHRQGCGTGWGLAQSLDLGLPGLGPDSPHDFSLYTVWFPTLDLFHNPGKGESRMPWLLLGNPPPYAPEGLRNSSQPTWVGGWKQRVEAWYMLSKSRIGWTLGLDVALELLEMEWEMASFFPGPILFAFPVLAHSLV